MGLWPKLDGSRRSAFAAELAGYVEVARFYLRREGLGSTLTRLGRFLKVRAAPRTIAQRRAQTFTVGCDTDSNTNPSKPSITLAALPLSCTWGLLQIRVLDTTNPGCRCRLNHDPMVPIENGPPA